MAARVRVLGTAGAGPVAAADAGAGATVVETLFACGVLGAVRVPACGRGRRQVPRHVRSVTEWPMSATTIQKGPLRERISAELVDGKEHA